MYILGEGEEAEVLVSEWKLKHFHIKSTKKWQNHLISLNGCENVAKFCEQLNLMQDKNGRDER